MLFEKKLNEYTFFCLDSRPDFPIRDLKQIHSNIIYNAKEVVGAVEGDGLVSVDQTLAIKTADCIPIAIIGQLGYGLLHAGWRGVKANVWNHDLVKKILPIQFFLGPSIHSCCYEVTEEFKENFPHSKNFINRNNLLYFDLQTEAQERISQTFKASVEDSKICTCCNEKFHSYRRDKTKKRIYNILKK